MDYQEAIRMNLENNGHKVIYASENIIHTDKERVRRDLNFHVFKRDFDYGYECLAKKILRNINFNVAFLADYERFLYLKENKSRIGMKNTYEIATKFISFFIKLIIDHNIDCALYENISGFFSYCAYFALNHFQKRYAGWISARIPSRYELWSDPYGNIEEKRNLFISLLENPEKCIFSNETNSYLDNIVAQRPDYMINNRDRAEINYLAQYANRIDRFIWIICLGIKVRETNSIICNRLINHSLNIARFRFLRQLKLSFSLIKYSKSLPESNYFIFPLHVQPEASVSVIAPYYCNLLDVIRNVAFSLPNNAKLIIKDHPNGAGFQSLNFYNEILLLPNTFLAKHNTDNELLIKHSIGVLTISSTMGFDALLREKPVIVFGNVFYSYHPFCYKVESYNDLYEKMKMLLSFSQPSFKNVNISFLEVYYRTTYEGKLFDIQEESVERFTKNLLLFAKL
jgi:hypothetical protein